MSAEWWYHPTLAAERSINIGFVIKIFVEIPDKALSKYGSELFSI